MKRNVLLFFGLIGIVLMEWGCSKDCDEYETYEIIDLTVGTVRRDTTTEIVEYKYNSHIFSLVAQTNLVANIPILNSGLLATVGPFGCGEIETHISYTAEIDSFSIKTDKVYSSDLGNDLSNSLAHVHNESVIEKIELSRSHQMMPIEFALKFPPTQTDTFQFTFQFFDTEGNIFESATDPLIITP